MSTSGRPGTAGQHIGAAATTAYAVVIPTVGRPCLADCLRALGEAGGPAPDEVVVVDDRPAPQGGPSSQTALPLAAAGSLYDRTRLLTSGGRGPAAARNTGLHAVDAPWVVFLDDDVRVMPGWGDALAADLAAADARTGGVQGRLTVPMPPGRRPTDAERGTAGLEDAAWATADMAYRARALEETDGFDERFPRAFREDADLALRMQDAGWTLHLGDRRTEHPVRPGDRRLSVRAQRGNADDALMTRLHGADWWVRARAPRGRLPRHLAVTAAAAAALVLAASGRTRPAVWAAAVWAVGTAEFALARIVPGPRTADEVATMLCTSVVIPPFAVRHWLTGRIRHRGASVRRPAA